MDLQELVNLITVRQYVVNSTGNSSFTKKTINTLCNMLVVIDNKIVESLQSEEFKTYINYADVKRAVEEVRNINNIKSGLPVK